jgi:hypothetical protein
MPRQKIPSPVEEKPKIIRKKLTSPVAIEQPQKEIHRISSPKDD